MTNVTDCVNGRLAEFRNNYTGMYDDNRVKTVGHTGVYVCFLATRKFGPTLRYPLVSARNEQGTRFSF